MEAPEHSSQQSTSTTEGQSVTLSLTHAISICASGLLVCFFLPWIDFLVKVSGFAIAKEGGKHVLFWAVPIFSIWTIVATFTRRSPQIISLITGLLPFAILAYGFSQLGKDLFRMLALGSYLSLILGLTLIILPRRMK